MAKNKTIPSRERTMVLRVLHFFEAEKREGDFVIPVDQALKRTCVATGVSLSTITRIKREEKQILQACPSPSSQSNSDDESTSLAKTIPVVTLPTPGKKRRQPAHNKIGIDDAMISSLRSIVLNFQTERNDVPTLKKILAVAKEQLNFPGQKDTLRKILKEKLGYELKVSRKKKAINRKLIAEEKVPISEKIDT